jgi:hypothetical protein
MRKIAPFILLAIFSQPAAAGPFPVDDYVVELGEKVDGRDLSAFVNDWWQWAYSMPDTDSPLRDTTGTNCGVNQQDSVWYLAGGVGSSRISRSCTVPPGQYLFFPVINMLIYTPPGVFATCADTKAAAARNNDRFVYIRVSVDGARVRDAERFRLASTDCFNLTERVEAPYPVPAYAPSATDGYWLMLRPLPPGRHRLEFQAFYTNPDEDFGGMVQNISYELTIPEH